MMRIYLLLLLFAAAISLPPVGLAAGGASRFYDYVYDPGELKPVDSELKVSVGDEAPDFTLPAIAGEEVRLADYRGEKNVVLSFIPAAWTPVCSGQWPGYNIIKDRFRQSDAVLLGISADNVPSLHAWVEQIGGLWFEVLSDFWPHGAVADRYGVLRSDGTADRALFFIDKKGIITAVKVVDINTRPPLEYVFAQLDALPAD